MAVTQYTDPSEQEQPKPPKPSGSGDDKQTVIRRAIPAFAEPSQYNTVATVEREVGSLIPADVSLSLTSLGYDERELRRAARMAAKVYDVSPQLWVAPGTKLKDYIDPITGGPLRASTLRRGMQGAEPAAFAAMIAQAVEMSAPSQPHGGREGRQEASEKRTSQYFSAISRVFRDADDLDAATAIGLAIALSEDASIRPKDVERNLDAVKRWGNVHGESDWRVLFALATKAAKSKIRLNDPSDVDRMLAPELAMASDQELATIEAQGYTKTQINEAMSYQRRAANALAQGRQLPPPSDPTITAIIALLPGQGVIGEGSGLAGLRALAQRTTGAEDYFARANQLNDEVVATKEAFQNSWLNRNILTPALKALDPLNRVFEVGAITVQYAAQNPAGLGGPGQAGLQLGINVSRARAGQDPFTTLSLSTMTEQYTDDIKAAWSGDIRMADTLVRDWGVSRFQAEAMEFAVGWGLDPLIIGGKVARTVRMRTVNPDVLAAIGKSGWSTQKGDRYLSRIDNFVNNETDSLLTAMRDSDEAVVAWTRRFRRPIMGGSVFDTTYLLRARRELLKQFDNTAAGQRMAKEAVDEVLRVHLGAVPLKVGSVADVSYSARLAAANDAKKRWLGRIADGAAYNDYLKAQDNLLTLTPDLLPPVRLEIPKRARPVPLLGATETFAAKYEDIFGNSLFGRNLAKFPNIDPGLRLKVHEDPQRWFKLQSRRAGLPDREVLEWEAKAAMAFGTPAPEVRLKELLDEFHTKVWKMKTSAVGMSDDASAKLLDDFTAEMTGSTDAARSFGAFNDAGGNPLSSQGGARGLVGSGATRPIARTQLVNELPAMDPVLMQRFINEYTGTVRRMRATFYRELRKSDPAELASVNRELADLAKREADHRKVVRWVSEREQAHQATGLAETQGDRALKRVSEDIRRGEMPPDVRAAFDRIAGPTLDQETRELLSAADADWPRTGTLFDVFNQQDGLEVLREGLERRAASLRRMPEVSRATVVPLHKWFDDLIRPLGRAMIRLFKLTHVARPAYIARVVMGDELLRALATTQSAWEHSLAYGWHAAALRAVPDAPLRNAVGERIGSLGARRVADDVIPGPASVGREPLANTYLDQRDLLADSMKTARRRQKVIDASGEWTVITPAQGQDHLDIWARQLNNQLAQSPTLRHGLELIESGAVRSEADLKVALLRFTERGVGHKELKQIGREAGDELELWADEAANIVWSYTGWGQDDVARLALAREVTPEHLAAQFQQKVVIDGQEVWGRPIVNGPRLARVMKGGESFAGWATNKWYGLWVRGPENILNRQPYYRTFYTRARAAYARVYKDLDMPLTETRMVTRVRSEDNTVEAAIIGLSKRDADRAAVKNAAGFSKADTELGNSLADAIQSGRGLTDAQMVAARSIASKYRSQLRDMGFDPDDLGTGGFKVRVDTVQEEVATELGTLVDGAARKFALANSKKIMFDFTENSRLGEMLSFVFPFMQPWAENFFVWGHVLTNRNPAMVGYVNRLAELGKNTGFIRKDPDTGEYVIPETWWLGLSPMLFVATGLLDSALKGTALTTPLTSLNLFASSTLEVAGVPIPAPSMSPWMTWGIAQLTKDKNLSPWASKYLFAYGPGAKDIPALAQEAFLPRPAVTLLQAWAPEFINNEDRLNNIAIEMMAAQQYNGQEVNPDEARRMAQGWMSYVAVTQLFFPGAIRAEFPHDWLNREYEDKADEFGGGPDGYTQAREWFHATYPQYDAITIAKTINAKVADYITADGIPFLEGEPAPDMPRPPASAFFEKLLKAPEFRDFATNPETAPWAAGLAAGYGSDKANEFDFTAYFQQLNRGDVKTRSVQAAFESLEAGRFWEKWLPIDDMYDRALEYYDAQGLDENDEQIIKLRLEKAQTLEALAAEFKVADARYLIPRPGGGYQFTFESGEQWPEGMHPWVLKTAYQVALAPETEGFPAFDGLREYLTIRDETKAELQNKGFWGLENLDASGVKSKYETRINELFSTPEGEAFRDTFYSLWFENDLGYGVVTKGREILNKWQETKPEKYQGYVEFSTDYDRFSTRVADLEAAGAPQAEISAVYQARTEFVNNVYRENPDYLNVWMKERSAGERRQLLEPTYTRPVVFWSAWDWDQAAGVKLSKRGLNFLEQYQRRNTEIALWSEQTDGIESSAELRIQLAKDAAAWAKKDKTFAAAVEAMNTWGYGAIAKGYTEQGGRAEKAWTAIIEYANNYRLDAQAAEIHGDDPSVEFDRDNRAWWNNGRDNVRNYLEVLKDWDPTFAQQWDDLTETADGSSMEWLFPRIYFAVGEVND